MDRLTVEHSPDALADLEALYDRIANQSTRARERMGECLLATMQLLSEHPAIAPAFGPHGLRLKFVPRTNLVILCRFNSASVQILRINDGRQDRPFSD